MRTKTVEFTSKSNFNLVSLGAIEHQNSAQAQGMIMRDRSSVGELTSFGSKLNQSLLRTAINSHGICLKAILIKIIATSVVQGWVGVGGGFGVQPKLVCKRSGDAFVPGPLQSCPKYQMFAMLRQILQKPESKKEWP